MPPNTPRRPSAGWTCREVLDAKAVTPAGAAECEFCGTRIRWVHVLEHADFRRPAEAGGCCAARLCSGYDAGAAEREVRNRAARRTRFADPRRWVTSRNNPANVWRRARTAGGADVRVTVFAQGGRFKVFLAGVRDDVRFCHDATYGSQAAARAAAFDLVDQPAIGR